MIGGIVLIALLLVTFVCYQIYYKWSWTKDFRLANILPEFLQHIDDTDQEEDDYEKEENATKVASMRVAKPSTQQQKKKTPLTPKQFTPAAAFAGNTTTVKTTRVLPADRTAPREEASWVREFMRQEAERSERLMQKLDKLVKKTTRLTESMCDGEELPFDPNKKGYKLTKKPRSISQRVVDSIDAKLGRALDTSFKKMMPPSFVKTQQPQSIYVTGADYNPTTELLTVPVHRRNCHMFELVQGSVPRLMYTVNSFCNSFSVFVATTASTDPTDYTEYSGTLTSKDYSLITLATELQTQMRAATDSGATALSAGLTAGTFDVSVNTTTQKFTFATGTDYFVIKFTDPDLGYMLGFGLHNTFPTTTTVVSTSPAGTYTVVDTIPPVSGAIAGPAVALTYPTLAVGGTEAIYTQVAYAPTQSLESSGRADLFGGRYVVLECEELKASFGDDTTVARITQVNEMNSVDWKQGHSFERRFLQPTSLRTLSMKVKMAMPSGKLVAADTSLLSFDLQFVVLFDNVTMNREHYMPGGKYNMNMTPSTV